MKILAGFFLFLAEFFGDVFLNVLDRGEVEIVAIVAAVEVAVVILVLAADFGAFFVDFAEVFRREVAAFTGDVDIPLVFVNKDGKTFMGEIPANIVKVIAARRLVNRQRYIAATQPGTIGTKAFFIFLLKNL